MNTMHPTFWRELDAVLNQLHQGNSARLLVISRTGKYFSAGMALAYGLVNAVFDTPEALLAGAMQCAKDIAAKPPVAMWGTKQAVHYARDHTIDDSLKQMGWLQSAIWSNQHVMESVMAMKSKRAGDFPELSALQKFSEIGL